MQDCAVAAEGAGHVDLSVQDGIGGNAGSGVGVDWEGERRVDFGGGVGFED